MAIKFKDDWDMITRIDYLQRRIIVSSIIYYELDDSVISDATYDGLSRQLKSLMDECENVEDSKYWYVFKDWDGSTGYFLYHNLSAEDRQYLDTIAYHVHKAYKEKY